MLTLVLVYSKDIEPLLLEFKQSLKTISKEILFTDLKFTGVIELIINTVTLTEQTAVSALAQKLFGEAVLDYYRSDIGIPTDTPAEKYLQAK